MDPATILPFHIFQQIISFFDAKEIKNFIFVNKLWYQLITSSCIWDKKTVLALRSDWICDDQDIASFIECGKKRNFHSLLLSDCTDMYDQVLEVVKTPKLCGITSVSIFDMNFDSFQAFTEFVKSFETTVVNLTLERVKLKDDEICDNNQELNLSYLQNFKVSNCDSKIFLACLQNSTKLTSLNLENGIDFDNKLIGVFKNATMLKKLSINTQLLCSLISDENFKKVKFQLKELSITYIDFTISSAFLDDIEKFLESQPILEILHISEWLSFDILKCALRMKNLRELSLFSLPMNSWNNTNFPSSTSIETLDIRVFYYDDENCDDVKKLLAAVPNVIHLKLRSINDEIAQFIEQNLKKVTTISLIHPSLSRNLPNISIN